MSLSVEMSGEDVANLSAATGNHDAETCCHGRRLYERMITHTLFCEPATCGSQLRASPPLNPRQTVFEAAATADTPA